MRIELKLLSPTVSKLNNIARDLVRLYIAIRAVVCLDFALCCGSRNGDLFGVITDGWFLKRLTGGVDDTRFES
jgi:hypothetical protein